MAARADGVPVGWKLDVVHLKTGGKLFGLVEEENDSEVRLRTVAIRDRVCHDFPYQDAESKYDPSVVLDFDYTVLMPRRAEKTE